MTWLKEKIKLSNLLHLDEYQAKGSQLKQNNFLRGI